MTSIDDQFRYAGRHATGARGHAKVGTAGRNRCAEPAKACEYKVKLGHTTTSQQCGSLESCQCQFYVVDISQNWLTAVDSSLLCAFYVRLQCTADSVLCLILLNLSLMCQQIGSCLSSLLSANSPHLCSDNCRHHQHWELSHVTGASCKPTLVVFDKR